MPRRPDVPCAGCGKLIWRGSSSLPAGQAACHACRRARPRFYGNAGRHQTPCPVCGKAFVRRASSSGQPVRTCSRACGQQLRKTLTGVAPCDDCGEMTSRERNQFGRLCEGCARARRLLKYMRRRNVTRLTDITAAYLRDLVEGARECPLCSAQLVDTAGTAASKQVDHIVPLAIGGTHTIGNVRVICRTCNLRRPKDGSDLDGFQPTLWAEDQTFVATLARRPRGTCECGARKVDGRCWDCRPSARPRRQRDGQTAAQLRAQGLKWREVAAALGMASPAAAYTAASLHGLPEDKANWPGRQLLSA